MRNEKKMNTPVFVSERDQKLAAQVSDYNVSIIYSVLE